SEMAFERAAVLRDQSRALKRLLESGGVSRVKRSELEQAMSGKLKPKKAGMPGARSGKRPTKRR
ncbi:MAG: hypothetical protein KF705_06550, partial [Phycisphaeraceae bacterium]|nr:hypothetical protein [Phycisphaeraceae bacterium]